MAINMLNSRLNELRQTANPPFTGAGAGYGEYFLAKTKEAFSLTANSKIDGVDLAMKTILEEAERARQEMAEREALTHQPVDENTEQAQNEDYSDRHIGRNEPCPCGSGKKYKHCHGSKARYA